MKEVLQAQLLRRFVDEPERMSRNKNFHAYLDPKVRQAARIGRILRSLRSDLRGRAITEAGLSVDPESNGHLRYILELQYDNGTRRTHLDRAELDLLQEDELVSSRLGQLFAEAA